MAKDYKIKIGTEGAVKSQKQLAGLGKSLGKLAVIGAGVVGAFKLLSAGFRLINDSIKKTTQVASDSIKVFADLEKGIAEIRTLTGGMGESVDELRSQMIEMGNASGQAFDVLTKAKYDIVSAGFSDAADSVKVFNTAVKLGIGGVTDSATAVDLMTTSLNAFGKSADEAEDVSDILFQTVKMGKTTITELSASFGRALPFAKSLGVSLEDTATMMSFLTSKGINTAEATTSLAAMFRSLESPASEAANMMAFYNIEVQKTADGQVDLMETLKQFAGLDPKIISKMIPEARAQLAIKSMTDDLGTLDQMLRGMEGRAGASKDAFNIMTETWSFKFEQIKQKIQGIMAEIGHILTTQFMPVLDTVNDLLDKAFQVDFKKLSGAFKKDMSLLFDPLKKTASILGKMWVKTFIEMVKLVAPGVWEIFKELIKVIAGMWIDWGVFIQKKVFNKMFAFIRDWGQKISTIMGLSVDSMILDFQTIPEKFMKAWHKVVQLSENAWDIMVQIGKTSISLIVTLVKDIPNMVAMGFFGAIRIITNLFADLKATIKTVISTLSMPFLYMRDIIVGVMDVVGAYIKKGFLTAVQAVMPAIEALQDVWNWIADAVGMESWKMTWDSSGIREGIAEANEIIEDGFWNNITNRWEKTNKAYVRNVKEHWQEAEVAKVESEEKYQQRIKPYLDKQEKLYDEHYSYVAKNHDKLLADMEKNREKYEESIAPYNAQIVEKAIKRIQGKVDQYNQWVQEQADFTDVELEPIQMPAIEGIEDIEGAYAMVYNQITEVVDAVSDAKTDLLDESADEAGEYLKTILGLDEKNKKTYAEEMADLLAELGLVWSDTLDDWILLAPKIEEILPDTQDWKPEPIPLPEFEIRNADWLDMLLLQMQPAIDLVKQFAGNISSGLNNAFQSLVPTIRMVGNALGTAFAPFKRVLEEITDELGKFGVAFAEWYNDEKTQAKIQGFTATMGAMTDMFGAQSEYINSEIAEGMDKIKQGYDEDSEALAEKHANDLALFEESEEYKFATRAGKEQLMAEFLANQAEEEKALEDKKLADEEALNKKYAKEKLRIWKAEKLAKISTALMNGAEAFTKALGLGPIAGPIAASMVAGMVATQVNFIRKTKPPKFSTGGFVGGKSHERGGTIIEAEAGEYVINKNSAQAIGYSRLDQLNQMKYGGKVPKYENGGSVNGSGVTVNVNFSGNVLSKDFIEREAIPSIRKAVKRGVDIGI